MMSHVSCQSLRGGYRRCWVQFSLTTQFFVTRISSSLASVGPVGTAAPEREQAAPTAAARTQEGEY
jgi:hypothetical protein